MPASRRHLQDLAGLRQVFRTMLWGHALEPCSSTDSLVLAGPGWSATAPKSEPGLPGYQEARVLRQDT
eukprot:351996-Chlamydomonas_euryale.AAC.3